MKNPNERIGLAFMAGSATTYLKKNPSFHVLEADEELLIPLNYHTYFFNISKA
jgi:hypothetical protein